MHAFAEMFIDAGWGAYPVLLFSLISLPLSVAALTFAGVKPRVGRVITIAALLCVALTLGAGILGRSSGLGQMELALEHVNPADAALIRRQGYIEARGCVTLALILVAPSLLFGLAGLLVGWRDPEGRGLLGPGACVLALALGVTGLHIQFEAFPGSELSNRQVLAVKAATDATRSPDGQSCEELAEEVTTLPASERNLPQLPPAIQRCLSWMEGKPACGAGEVMGCVPATTANAFTHLGSLSPGQRVSFDRAASDP